MVVYKTTVTAVGDLVSDFRDQGLLVFFGEQAPAAPAPVQGGDRSDRARRDRCGGDGCGAAPVARLQAVEGDEGSEDRRGQGPDRRRA